MMHLHRGCYEFTIKPKQEAFKKVLLCPRLRCREYFSNAFACNSQKN